MSQHSEFLSQEAEKNFPSTSDFHFPNIGQVLETANQNNLETLNEACVDLVSNDQLAPKLRLILSNGNRHTFPYAYFLRTEYDVEGILSIFTTEKEIIIEGRGLDYLEDRLYENQVKGIKEVKRAFDTGVGLVFVKKIEIKDRR